MNELRDRCEYEDRDDISAASFGVIHIPPSDDKKIQRGYIVMSWYKDRGTTGQAYVMCDDYTPETLQLKTAEFVLTQKKMRNKLNPRQ